MTRLDTLDLLIGAGWGDKPLHRIPPDVLAAAEHGEAPPAIPPRKPPKPWRRPCPRCGEMVSKALIARDAHCKRPARWRKRG